MTAVSAESRTGLVLAGGGARGAYEAGALSELLPVLERRGQRPRIITGASVGAINAVALAARSHLPAEQAVGEMLEIWRTVSQGDVVRPVLRSAPGAVLRYLGQLLAVPGMRLPSLLDSAPLWDTVDRWVDWEQLHRCVQDGCLERVAVVATSARTGKTVVFTDGVHPLPIHRSHAVAYVETELGLEHVRASGSIPVIWPPAEVTTPPKARGWYFDGGTRLNTPIKPTLDLGADRLVVAAVDSIVGPVMDEDADEGAQGVPDFGDGILHLLEGTLVDPVIEDMRRLGSINAFYAGDIAGPGPRLYRSTRGKDPYRVIPYIFVGPPARGQIGRLATEVFHDRYAGLKGLRSPDLVFLNELLGGNSPTHGELLSLLFFDSVFIAELIRLGQENARSWLSDLHDGDGPWQHGPLTTFTMPRQWTAG